MVRQSCTRVHSPENKHMEYLNVEIKAICRDPAFVRNYLLKAGAAFKGVDEQTDTYFNVANGRLKLREGNIENNLIFYERGNQAGPKNSRFHLVPVPDGAALKEALSKANGLLVVVQKKREIYYIRNVKFHIDEVPGLGSFAEIEAGNKGYDLTQEELDAQCRLYMRELGIEAADLIDRSYSDMLLEKISEG